MRAGSGATTDNRLAVLCSNWRANAGCTGPSTAAAIHLGPGQLLVHHVVEQWLVWQHAPALSLASVSIHLRWGWWRRAAPGMEKDGWATTQHCM